MMEAKSFEAWARPQLQNVVDAKWHFFMANYLFFTAPGREGKQRKRHYREACERCEKSFELDPSRWAVQILRSQILSELQDYEACIHILDALRETITLGQDKDYDKAYWKTIVPGMGDCHVNLKAHAKAASWFAQSYQFHMENDEVSDATEDVTCKLLKAYIEQCEPEKAWEIVRTLDARLKNNKSWLSSMLENPGSDLHEHLLLLARDHETYTIVDTYYDKTIKGTDEEAKKSGARHFLEYTKGRLHIYCGPRDTRKLVLSRWEAIASHLRNHDNDWGWWTRRQLIQEYTKAWYVLSSQPAFELHEQQEEINKLSKLSEINNDLNTYSLYREAKLALARFLTTHGKLEEAREVLKPLITKALEQARTVDEADDGYERLALILPTINDDVNALAAWSTMLPSPVKEDDGPDEGVTSPAIDNTPNGGTEPPATAGATEHDPPSNKDDSLDESAEDKKDSDELTGNAGFLCDGRCGRRWSYADDISVCRDCLCVQLDTGCLEKLKLGELPITICHPEHEHLHVPPFDERAWKKSSSSDLKVGSETMSRDAWLAMLEQEWGIKKEKPEVA